MPHYLTQGMCIGVIEAYKVHRMNTCLACLAYLLACKRNIIYTEHDCQLSQAMIISVNSTIYRPISHSKGICIFRYIILSKKYVTPLILDLNGQVLMRAINHEPKQLSIISVCIEIVVHMFVLI